MYAKKTKTLKTLVVVLSVILLMCLTVAGTLAYLQIKTNPVVNTFSPSDIGLTLTESTGITYKMVPGVDIPKDPTVTVSGDVDAYVFVEIVENGTVTVDGDTYGFDDFLSYAIDAKWTVLKETTDDKGNETIVVYRTVAANAAAADKTASVILGNKVTTNASVTKQMMNACADDTIKLTFTAYAIQQAGFADAATAWTEINS